MGFGGGVIPGHSGTQQKNRRAFQYNAIKSNVSYVARDKDIVRQRLKDNVVANRNLRYLSVFIGIIILYGIAIFGEHLLGYILRIN